MFSANYALPFRPCYVQIPSVVTCSEMSQTDVYWLNKTYKLSIRKQTFGIFCNFALVTQEWSLVLPCSRSVGRVNFVSFINKNIFIWINWLFLRGSKHSLCTSTDYIFEIIDSHTFMFGDSNWHHIEITFKY